MSTAKTMRAKKSSPEVIVPDKLYFRIGEVSKLSKLPAYVLRFWETEFPQLKPNKGNTGQRMYRRREVETVLEIKRLLYNEGYTIAGARERLKAEAKTTKSQAPLLFTPAPKNGSRDSLKRIRYELQEVLRLLGRKR
jgi:DNA-binding transcriptional MerR regulator